MKIVQILNNNVALVKRGPNESIVYSTGISFRKKVGDQITRAEIQKIYVLDSNDKLEHFSYLLAHTKEENIQIVNELIDYGEKELNIFVSDYLYLTLLDHIDFAIRRYHKNQFIQSPLHLEVKKYYRKHFNIGLEALKIINKHLHIMFPEEEAVSIALHFINMEKEVRDSGNNAIPLLDELNDILNIIKYHYNITFDEESMNYLRLVTHLQYFIYRLHKGDFYGSDEKELNNQVKALYPNAFKCVEKIRTYIKNSYNSDLSNDEETYLILHIHRVTHREERS